MIAAYVSVFVSHCHDHTTHSLPDSLVAYEVNSHAHRVLS